jgi:hypothetical protein
VLRETPVLGIFGFGALPIGHLLLGLTDNALWWVHLPIVEALEALAEDWEAAFASAVDTPVVPTSRGPHCPTHVSHDIQTCLTMGGCHSAASPGMPTDSHSQQQQQHRNVARLVAEDREAAFASTVEAPVAPISHTFLSQDPAHVSHNSEPHNTTGGVSSAASPANSHTLLQQQHRVAAADRAGGSALLDVLAKCITPRSHRIVSADVNVECGVIVVGDVLGCVSAFGFPASILTAVQRDATAPGNLLSGVEDSLNCEAPKAGKVPVQLPLIANLGRCHGNTPVTMIKCLGEHKVLTGGRNGELHTSDEANTRLLSCNRKTTCFA